MSNVTIQNSVMRPAIVWALLAGFSLCISLLGGSSRPDAIQIAALRPMAALFLVPAFYFITAEHVKPFAFLASFLALVTLWTALTIVPLPPSLWQNLPSRELVAELDELVGLGDVWRPISMVPSRGWNALAALIVPITAFLLVISLKASLRSILLLVLFIGLLDAVLGLLQIMSGGVGVLYFYAVTNEGSPVGIFANENHSAVLSAISLIVISRLALDGLASKEPFWLRTLYPISFVMVLLAALTSGSRAGFAATLFALFVTGAMLWASFSKRFSERRRSRSTSKNGRFLELRPRLVLVLLFLILAFVLALFVAMERVPALADIISRDAFEDLRWAIWPTLRQMMEIHWLLGSGFGSFEEVYHIHEPTGLLFPNYVNQAHNDWAQMVIEGGLPAIALVIAIVAWVVSLYKKILLRTGADIPVILSWPSIFAIIAAASIVDYPLRAPVFQVVAIWLLAAFTLERKALGSKE